MAFASSLMMGMAFGTMLCVTVFLPPLEGEFGWARGLTSFAYSSSAFLNGLFGIFIGRLIDRISIRPIVLLGAVMIGLSQVLLSRIDSLWQLYLLYGVLVGALGGSAFLVPLTANIGFWFDRHKGLAMSVVLAGQSLGGAAMPLLARWLLGMMDWREAYLVLGLVAWGVLLPLAFLIREPPHRVEARSSAGSATNPATVEPAPPPLANVSPKLLLHSLSAAIVLCCICMAIPLIHVYPLALERGIAPAEAAMVLGLMMGTSVVGRIGIGKIADHLGGLRSLLLASGAQTAVIFWFSQVGALPGFYTVAILFALGYGGVVPSYAIIIRELMPANKVGVSMGTIFFFGNLGMALGGYLGGLLYDLSGTYTLSYSAGTVAGLLNLMIVSFLLARARLAGHRLSIASA